MAKADNSASPMHEKVSGLEKWLMEVYAKTPTLPAGFSSWLARNIWWLALIGGILGLFSALGLWQVSQTANNLLYAPGAYSAMYGGDYRTVLWVTLIVTLAQSVMLLMASSGLKAQRKSGWNLLFYTGLLSLVMIVAYLFNSVNGLSSAIGSLIGAAVSFYFLFQIRKYFVGKS